LLPVEEITKLFSISGGLEQEISWQNRGLSTEFVELRELNRHCPSAPQVAEKVVTSKWLLLPTLSVTNIVFFSY